MKRTLIISFVALVNSFSYGQTNTFPGNGNVGIGTTSPLSILDIGKNQTTPSFRIGNSSYGANYNSIWGLQAGAQSIMIFGNNGQNEIRAGNTNAGGYLDFYTNNTVDYTTASNTMRLASNGNVGIGTTAPDRKFTIQRASNTSNTELSFKDQGGNTQVTFGLESATTNDLLIGGTAGMRFFTGSALGTSGVPSNEVMRITSGGNIGIGTTSPNALLHVFTSAAGMNVQLGKFEYLQPGAKGSGYISILSGTRTMDIEQNSGDGTFRFGTYMDSNIVNNYSASEGTYGNINFITGNGTGSSVAMTIGGGTQKGNIGIGTTNPQGYKLAVNGSAIATSMTVKLYANWPDYVFKKDYQLSSLADLKKFIDSNHRLPDMPSEEQIAKDGLNLGEMNKLLVKKVEELTLYLIEQQTVNQSQQAINTSLQKELDELKKEVSALKNKQ